MATDKYDLHTIDYSVQGWDAIMTTDMEKLDDVIHTRIVATAGETIAQYDAVYLESDGKYDKALADGVQQSAMGLALESAVLDDEIRIQRIGPITNAGWTWATDSADEPIGSKVYLDPATPGALTDVKPGSNAQMIGIILSATSIFIWIDNMEGGSGFLQNIVEDLTPQLGGDLDMNGHNIGGNTEAQLDDAVATKHTQNTDTSTSSNDFSIGDGIAGDKTITANNADAMKPRLRYNDTSNKWEFSNNGVDWNEIGTSGGLAHVVEDTSPELGGQLEVHEFDIKLDSLLSPDSAGITYSGITCDGILGATLEIGDLVYLNTADQRWELSDADAEATAGDVMLAIVLEAGGNGDTCLLLLQGFVREDTWNFTSYGQALFVGLTAGDMVQDVSGYTTGDIVRVVGYASTIATQIYFNPSGTWLEVS
jgi:hypothetical protein